MLSRMKQEDDDSCNVVYRAEDRGPSFNIKGFKMIKGDVKCLKIPTRPSLCSVEISLKIIRRIPMGIMISSHDAMDTIILERR